MHTACTRREGVRSAECALCVCVLCVCVCGFVSSYQLGNLMDCAASLYGRLYVHKYVCHKNRAYKAVNTHTHTHTAAVPVKLLAGQSANLQFFSREKSNNKRVISAIIVIACVCESINEISISFSLSHFN